ncbi:hypothetical protein LCGC14_3030320 [marine sediment metagenome]|uniref:Uncharacterized protein n=1 Tax=marine sediment metagenome TaxID=412755 RepID=A0A0F8WSY8_9ZZZZ
MTENMTNLAWLACGVVVAIAMFWSQVKFGGLLTEVTRSNQRADAVKRHDEHALLERVLERMLAERDHRQDMAVLHAKERDRVAQLDARTARVSELAGTRPQESSDEYEDGVPTDDPELASHE